jgi:hypothetical protein
MHRLWWSNTRVLAHDALLIRWMTHVDRTSWMWLQVCMQAALPVATHTYWLTLLQHDNLRAWSCLCVWYLWQGDTTANNTATRDVGLLEHARVFVPALRKRKRLVFSCLACALISFSMPVGARLVLPVVCACVILESQVAVADRWHQMKSACCELLSAACLAAALAVHLHRTLTVVVWVQSTALPALSYVLWWVIARMNTDTTGLGHLRAVVMSRVVVLLHIHLPADVGVSWWLMSWCLATDVLVVCSCAKVRNNLWLQDVFWLHLFAVGVTGFGCGWRNSTPLLENLVQRMALALVHTFALALGPAMVRRSREELQLYMPALDWRDATLFSEVNTTSDDDEYDDDDDNGHAFSYAVVDNEWNAQISQRLAHGVNMMDVLKVSRCLVAQAAILQLVCSSVHTDNWSMRIG